MSKGWIVFKSHEKDVETFPFFHKFIDFGLSMLRLWEQIGSSELSVTSYEEKSEH